MRLHNPTPKKAGSSTSNWIIDFLVDGFGIGMMKKRTRKKDFQGAISSWPLS